MSANRPFRTTRRLLASRRWPCALTLMLALWMSGSIAESAATAERAAGEPMDFEPLDVAEAIRQLDAADWLLQAEALHALQRFGVPSVGPRLRRMVEDDARPTWLRGEALVTLARADPETARPIVEARLADDDPVWRAAAARSLGARDAGTDPDTLIDRYENDPADSVRWAALQALAEAAPERAWKRIKARLEAPLRAAEVESALDILLTLDADPAPDALRGLLWHSDPAVRRAAGEGLVRRQVDAAPAWLIQRLAETRSGEERRHLQTLLPQLPTARVGRALVALLRQPDTRPATVRVGLGVLERIADHELADRLAAALPGLARHDATHLRRGLDLLRAVGGERHADAISRLLDDRHAHGVRRAAVEALGDLDVAHFQRFAPLMAADEHMLHAPVLDVLRNQTEGAPAGGWVEYLRPLLEHAADRPRIGVEAIRLLTDRAEELTDEAAAALVPRLRPLIGHDDEALRAAAMALLGQVAEGQAARHIAAARGYIAEWHLLGPFANDERNSGLRTVHPPERGVDLDATHDGADDRRIRWRRWRADSVDAVVELHTFMPLPAAHRTAYGYTTFQLPRRRTVEFTVEADESFKLFLNGGKIAEAATPGTERVRIPVPAGENALLIKVTNLRERWGFRVRLTTPAGQPLDRAGR